MNAADSIRRSVLLALARDRTPGWSFTGHFQALHWPVIESDAMTVAMPVGPHCTDAAGNVDLTSLLVLFDAALASPSRLHLAVGTRLATTHIHAQFTGAPARNDVKVEAHWQSATHTGAMTQRLSRGTVISDGHIVLAGSGAFVQLPPPADAGPMAPLPWQRTNAVDPPPLQPDELDAREREVYAACETALARSAADPRFGFLQHFWGILPEAAAEGALCDVRIGPQLANRVGHVQGGILMGVAAETAKLAVPAHPVLSNISAWFTAPGRGGNLLARSWAVHTGRSLAVVRTEITGPDGARVLEATTAHAA